MNALRPKTGENVVGAVVFFAYIVAAVTITGAILFNIIQVAERQETFSKTRRSVPIREKLSERQVDERKTLVGAPAKISRKLFPVAPAMIGFAVLSWNMLHFLMVSYHQWAIELGISVSPDFKSASGIRLQLWYIWSWATHSVLFQNFAEDLLQDAPTWKTVRLSLFYSYVINIWMSAQGRQVQVPNLWMYFLLNQILPISFAQNLFCTTLAASNPAFPMCKVYRGFKPGQRLKVASALGYIGLLWKIPDTLRSQWFVFNVLGLRALLFTPYLIDTLASEKLVVQHAHGTQCDPGSIPFVVAGTGFCAALSWALPVNITVQSTRVAVPNHAAAALVDDMLIGMVSFVLLLFVFPFSSQITCPQG